MKRDTKHQHAAIANHALHRIYTMIDTDLSVEELAADNGVSPYHFHRIFKEETGKNLHETVRSIRLQKAASLLLTNRYATISEIAAMCGYGSHASFIKAFRDRFGMTPTAWIGGGYLEYSRSLLATSVQGGRAERTFEGLQPVIVKSPGFHAVYLRHRGYDAAIRETWNRLYAYAMENDLPLHSRQIGLYHDNPAVTPLSECSYVAAVEVDPKQPLSGALSTFTIDPSLCARFDVTGSYGDVLLLIRYVYHIWLPTSGFEAVTAPAYAVYTKNHFLGTDATFDLEFYLPIRVV